MDSPDRSFFETYTPLVAEKLLGMTLARRTLQGNMSGKIVEVEAYRGFDDPASHAFVGKTRRNQVMFGKPGHSYVYFTYGFHHCLNVTTEPEGIPGAVLIRSLEPLEGIEVMMGNRGAKSTKELADGPGKLTKAMAIDGDLNGVDLTAPGELFLQEAEKPKEEVGRTGRVGITSGLQYRWRFFLRGNAFVSKGRATPVVPPQNP